MKEGHHRLKNANSPTMGRCFFCLKDKLCIAVEVSQETKSKVRLDTADNELLNRVASQVINCQFTCCSDCHSNKQKFAEAIVQYIFARYEIARNRPAMR